MASTSIPNVRALLAAFALGLVVATMLGCRKGSTNDNHAAPHATPVAGDVTVGKPPPNFTATTQDGKSLELAALKGKPVVVYFYPRDETPGCTKEACAFRDAWTELEKKDVVLIGISGDSDESHRTFAENHKLPFHLVSDPAGHIAGAFGVPVHLSSPNRQTFVIGADGNVKKIYRTVDVSAHAQEILSDVN